MSESTEPQAIIYEGGQEFTIRPPKLVAVSYTAIYDDGTVTVGAATHDGSERPFEVEFRNARGSSTPTL